ncbi:hypothetical protein G6F60_015555 [Rhizopus arrhizus]|nr:hypothetical protein G6F60_015555 [Rhizopus arrhizus]
MPGDAAHRHGHRRRPRRAGPDRCRAAAAGRRQDVEGAGRQGTTATGDPGQASHRRRRQPDRPDAGHALGPSAGDLRQQA